MIRKWSNIIGENFILHEIACTPWPRLVKWRTSSMDVKMTWVPMWQHFFVRGILFLG